MHKKIQHFFEQNATINRWVDRAKKVSFPGFEGVPIYYVLRFFFNEMSKDRVMMRASSVAFYFLLAIFPGIIFLFTLIPYLPIADFQEVLFSSMQNVLPQPAFEYLQAAIEDIINIGRVDLLSIGFVLAFFFSTTGVEALMRSFNKDHPIFARRSFIQKKLVSLKLTAVLFLLLLLSVGFIMLGDFLVSEAAEHMKIFRNWNIAILSILRWIIIIALFFTAISFIYYYGPATGKKWQFVTAGSTFATILMILTSVVFAMFVNNFNLYNKIYGSIGALLVILLWILFNSIILLVGFELNTSIKFQKNIRETETAT